MGTKDKSTCPHFGDPHFSLESSRLPRVGTARCASMEVFARKPGNEGQTEGMEGEMERLGQCLVRE